jgi:hypothetical protein
MYRTSSSTHCSDRKDDGEDKKGTDTSDFGCETTVMNNVTRGYTRRIDQRQTIRELLCTHMRREHYREIQRKLPPGGQIQRLRKYCPTCSCSTTHQHLRGQTVAGSKGRRPLLLYGWSKRKNWETMSNKSDRRDSTDGQGVRNGYILRKTPRAIHTCHIRTRQFPNTR